MPHSTSSTPFNVLTDTVPADHTLPAFMVSTTRGFLPRDEPIVDLPEEFAVFASIIDRMPIKKLDGSPGLLATFELGRTVHEELPDLSEAVDKYKHDLVLMNALYRDYSFLASAYLLEPCHERHVRGEEFGLGRQTLPKNIALPIVKVAERYALLLHLPCHECYPNNILVPASSPSWNMLARMRSTTTV